MEDKEMEIRPEDQGTKFDVEQALKRSKIERTAEVLDDEYFTLVAVSYRRLYQALVKEGFGPGEAVEIICARARSGR